jgi:uncharacterized protein (DUF2235 family)
MSPGVRRRKAGGTSGCSFQEELIMPKNIAFFADGTWNGPEQDNDHDNVPDPTNVFLLFDHLEGIDTPQTKLLQNEQEQIARDATGNVTQVSKYLHGVGDSRNIIHKIVGGTFGAGVVNRIVRGYTYISRWYEPNDRIYIAGFSRGAYTARALAGMICSVGLLDSTRYDPNDREAAYRRGMSAWTLYRRNAGKKASFLDYVRGVSSVELKTADFRKDVPIHAAAVWDTVGALGIPSYSGDTGRNDIFQFADTKLNDKVRHGFHALSIDEQRADFIPTRWDARDRVEEVWFAGAHSNVGGGYAERHLSDIALLWMAERLAHVGLRVHSGLKEVLKPDPHGRCHEPWTELPWKHLPFSPRQIPAGAVLHESVRTRRMRTSTPA